MAIDDCPPCAKIKWKHILEKARETLSTKKCEDAHHEEAPLHDLQYVGDIVLSGSLQAWNVVGYSRAIDRRFDRVGEGALGLSAL